MLLSSATTKSSVAIGLSLTTSQADVIRPNKLTFFRLLLLSSFAKSLEKLSSFVWTGKAILFLTLSLDSILLEICVPSNARGNLHVIYTLRNTNHVSDRALRIRIAIDICVILA